MSRTIAILLFFWVATAQAASIDRVTSDNRIFNFSGISILCESKSALVALELAKNNALAMLGELEKKSAPTVSRYWLTPKEKYTKLGAFLSSESGNLIVSFWTRMYTNRESGDGYPMKLVEITIQNSNKCSGLQKNEYN